MQTTVQSAKAFHRASDDVVVSVQFTNTGSAAVTLPQWLFDGDEVDRSFLKVTRNGVAVPYTAALVKRANPGADELIVTLTDKREFKARVIGADKRTDVALVKIDASGLPSVKIGDSNRLKVGEWVMAIGSPFGLDNTVTAGIVSAKARDTGDYVPFIQTDVAINPGNSGGPLINLRGEVVGINSQIYSRSGGFMGISFAIPMDEAMRVSDQLRTSGRVIRGRIGVQIAPVTKEVAESIGLGAKAAGALVRSVEKDSPADKAGVEAGDIITKVDGKAVERSGDLPRIIGSIKPGTRSTLTLFRRGSTRELSVTVGEFEEDRQVARRSPGEPGAAPSTKSALGLTVSDLGEAQKRELRVKGGVKVDAVEGAAARAGLREGDVILSIDNTEVADSKQFAAIAAKAEKARAVSVRVSFVSMAAGAGSTTSSLVPFPFLACTRPGPVFLTVQAVEPG